MTLVLRLTWDTLSRISGCINPSVAFVFVLFSIKQHGILRVNYIILCTLKFDISAICIHMQSPPPPTTMSGRNSAHHFQFVHFLFHFIPHIPCCLWMVTTKCIYLLLLSLLLLFLIPPTTHNMKQSSGNKLNVPASIPLDLLPRASHKGEGIGTCDFCSMLNKSISQ